MFNFLFQCADISEVPICESVISCDNLLCDGHGRSPNPTVIVQISEPNRLSWIRYGRTEVVEVCLLKKKKNLENLCDT